MLPREVVGRAPERASRTPALGVVRPVGVRVGVVSVRPEEVGRLVGVVLRVPRVLRSRKVLLVERGVESPRAGVVARRVGRVVVGRAVGREVGLDVGRAVGRGVGRETGLETGRETGLETGRETGLETGREPPLR